MIIDTIFRLIDPLTYAKKHGMKVGKGVTLAGRFGTSFGSEPYLITLEDNVRLSGGCNFITHDGGVHAFRDLEKYKGVQKFGTIHVGEHTFVGYGVSILPGVNIGKRCVIGVGAIVTDDIPDGSVAVGVPARVICTTEEYAEKCLTLHNEIGYDPEQVKIRKKEYLLELFRENK